MTGKRPHKSSGRCAELGELDGLDKRTKIRNKARDIFIRYGYRKTTIEDIGKACGLVKTSLYHYFSSKEEIFADVVRVESENVLAQIRAAIKATDDPKAQLIAMVKTRFKVIGDIIGEIIGHEAAMELEELLPLAARVRQQFFKEEAKIVEQILEDGQRREIFKNVRSPSIPLLIISGLRGIELHFAEIKGAPSLEEGIESMLTLLFEGICL